MLPILDEHEKVQLTTMEEAIAWGDSWAGAYWRLKYRAERELAALQIELIYARADLLCAEHKSVG